MDILLSLFTGPTGLLAGVGALIAAVVAIYFKGRGDGTAKGENKALKERVKAQEQRLEMEREATDIERATVGMSDEDARKEAERWARK